MTVSNDTPQRVTLVAVDIAKMRSSNRRPRGDAGVCGSQTADRTSSIWPVICRDSRVQS
jgi:hypothetical protein